MGTRRRLVSHVGFTLIELLVVISIIALLIAMLLPALTQARTMAKLVLCQNQIRQLSLGHNTYAYDNDYWFPYGYNLVSAAGLAVDNGEDPLSTDYWGGEPELLMCPDTEAIDVTISGYAPPGKHWNIGGREWRWLSYRMTASVALSSQWWQFFGSHINNVVDYRDDNKISSVVPNLELTDRVLTDPRSGARAYIHPPDLMPMFFDGRRNGYDVWMPYTGTHLVTNNHADLNGVNVIFLDGHIQWGDQDDDPERITVGLNNGGSGKIRW